MRKFISLMSAAAVLASVAVVPITASAEDAFTYDGSDISGWTTGDSHLLITKESDDNGDFVKITTDGSSNYNTSYALPAAAQLEDNYVIEYDIMVHQSNGMGRFGRYTQAAFISADATKDTRDFTAYKELLGQGGSQDAGGNGYVTGVASSVTSIYGINSAFINYTSDIDIAPSTDDSGIVSDVWYRVQTAVSGSTATVNVIDGKGNKIVDNEEYTNSASKLSSIFVTVGRGDANVTGGGVVALDNVRIYEGEAETLKTDDLRRALETYTVEFVADGETISSKDVIEGNKIADIPAVPEKAGYIGKWVLDDGTAFTSATVITDDTTVTAEYALAVDAVAKAATIVTDGELRISEKTAGAVFRFETKDLVPDGQTIKKAELIVKAAPRSYKDSDARFENTEIWTIRVKSNWNSESNEITADAWNNLSKDDAFNKQYTAKYPSADPNAVPPYQTLNAIDVTDMINEDGVAVFAFKTGSAREHAIDAVLALTFDNGDEPSPSTEGIEIHGIGASTIVTEDGELRVSDGTQGAVFRFDTSDVELDEGQYIQKAELAILAAPRSYSEKDNRFANTEIWTYKVSSSWSGESTEISEDEWNKLSKNDPIDKQYTANYPTTDPTAVPPYQHLNPIDVTDMLGENGISVFAVKASTAREHAVDAFLVLQIGESNTTNTTVAAVAKASTKIEDGEFRISDGTNGAVYKFDINGQVPADEQVVDVMLYVSAAPRSYKTDSSRFESTSIMTYKVGSTWSSESEEISTDEWNKLSKNDPINTQNTSNYPSADPDEKAPYQVLEPIDVTNMFTDGVATFAFKTGSAREHAIDAYVIVTTAKIVWTKFAATKDANGVLTDVTMTAVDDPVTVELGTNEYLWNQFQVPYAQAD